MKIADLATKPQLIKHTITSEDLVKKYGEELEFYTLDRQPIEKFIKFAGKEITLQDYPDLIAMIEPMILDEAGNPVSTDGKSLPWDVLSECSRIVMEQLGK